MSSVTQNGYRAIEVEPLTHVVGAEISGINLAEPLSSEQVDEIKRAVGEHCVVFFHNQQVDIRQYESFARQLGSIYTQSLGFGSIDSRTEGITVLDAPAFRGQGESWHVDELWSPTPPTYAMLRADELPGEGGDTAWASMYEAYDQLSKPMRDFLENLTAEYTAELIAQAAIRRMRYLDGDDSSEAAEKRVRFEKVRVQAEEMPPVRHALVKVHPITGRKHLYFSRNAAKRIVELAENESNAVLQFLFHHIEALQFQYRNRWSIGKIALWDERCAQHAVIADYEGRRVIWRCYVGDEKAG